MARLRSAPVAHQPISSLLPGRHALKEKTNTTRTKALIHEDNEGVDDFVKDARSKRGRAKKVAQDEDELIMAGGLGEPNSDEQTAPRSEPPMTTDELAKSDAQAPPAVKGNRRPPRTGKKIVQSEAQRKVLADMKNRMQATARKEASTKRGFAPESIESTTPSSDALPGKLTAARTSTKSAAERSEFSLSPSPPPSSKLSAVKKHRSSLVQPGSVLRPQGTPAVETSILALKNFKRRPRQPSMLQMVQQQRTASARPSAINARSNEDPNVFDLQDADDDDDFAPEAEGTPLHPSKVVPRLSVGPALVSNGKSRAAAVPPPAASIRKRKSDEADLSSTSALDALKAKRQKSTLPHMDDDAALASSRRGQPFRRSSSDRQNTPQPPITSDVQVINSPPSSTPPTEPSSSARRHPSMDLDEAIPSTEKQQDDVQYVPLNDVEDRQDQGMPNSTLARTPSSSPSQHDPLATQSTNIMAEPLTQVSPPPQPQEEKTKKKSKPMTTATLQSLLPKRRQPPKARHRKSEYDMDSDSDDNPPLDTSHLAQDEDELGGKARRQTKSAPAKGRKSTVAKAKSRRSKAANHRKSAAPTGRKSAAPPAKKKPSRTYGRATTSDKENENDVYESLDEEEESGDTSMSMHEAAQSKELEEARKKFADVDNWEMEFESMSVEEGRSSSQQWR